MGKSSDTAVIEIPNYRLIKPVGRGAFGQVWLAEEVLTRIYRAVKIVPPSTGAKQRIELDGVRQYQQRSHGHPHLVQVLTVGETSDSVYYVMEAADNALGSRAASADDYEPHTLAIELSRRRHLSFDEALSHTSAMLEGVDQLQCDELAHRDLKPENILFVDGTLKLADIGLSTSGPVGTAGTPAYQTPQNLPDDLYAVGVMLYQMISGEPASRFPELPADLDRRHGGRRLRETLQIINRAAHPDPEKRFDSAAQFLGALRRVRSGNSPRRVALASFAIAAIAIGTLTWTFWFNHSTPTTVD